MIDDEFKQFVQATAMLGALGQPREKERITVVDNPTETENLFGDISEIAGKELEVLEKNDHGDCICIFEGARGQNLVDVRACDVKNDE